MCSHPASAQQRPLLTQDAEVVGAGRVLLEAGIDHARGQSYPASGLTGNLTRLPVLGISVGISSIAELQFDGGIYDRLSVTKRERAPLSPLLTFPATTLETSDVQDFTVGTKVRLKAEGARSPSIGVLLSTRLPNATNGTGLGLDTLQFFTSLLAAKTIASVRAVGNVGVGVLPDPVEGNRQNDVVTAGFSLARALTDHAEVVAELNGRISTREVPFPGTESRGLLNFGARYTKGPVRVDAAVFTGLTTVDPTIGTTVGLTYVFRAFSVP